MGRLRRSRGAGALAPERISPALAAVDVLSDADLLSAVRYLAGPPISVRIRILSKQAPEAESLEVLLGIEGEAASHYFAAFSTMLKWSSPI